MMPIVTIRSKGIGKMRRQYGLGEENCNKDIQSDDK